MKVKVYTTSTCPYCDKTIEFLRSHGVEFESVSVDELSGTEQEEAIAEAYRLSGQRGFPVTDVNGSAVIGFDISKLRKLLGIEEKAEPPKAGTINIVKVFSYILGKEGREELKEEFERVAESLGMKKIVWHGETAEGVRETDGGGRLSLRFLQGMEGLVYILKATPDRDGHIDRDAFRVCPDPLKGRLNKLYQLDIFVGRSSEDLLAKDIKGQRLSDGTIVLSGYGAMEDSRRYVITPGSDSDTDRVVDEIVRLETCYNLLLSQRQKYLLLADQISRVDEGIATKMGVINLNISKADGETLKDWLQSLIVNFGEIAGIAEELKKHSSDTEGRRKILQSILERWKGEPVEGLQTISEPLQFYTRAVGDDYGRLIQRIEGIRREMRDVITILRARVDIIQQEQSLDIQKNMHETAKTQLKMQRVVERLEVLIGTYYMTVLAKMAFEAIEASGRRLPDKPIILASYLIPVFLVFAIFLSGKIGHLIETMRGRFRGKDYE